MLQLDKNEVAFSVFGDFLALFAVISVLTFSESVSPTSTVKIVPTPTVLSTLTEAGSEIVPQGSSAGTSILTSLSIANSGGTYYGTLDLTNSRYEAHGERAVKVSGSAFIPAERYTVKLEGAELAGYQSIVIGSVRDPFFIRQIDDWTARLQARIHARVKQVYGDRVTPDQYVINIRIYGKNGTMGPLEPVKEIRSHELCLLIEVTAPTQDLASSIAGIVRHQGLHLPIPEWSGLITALACPYNPAHLDRGAVYRFNVNHIVEPDDPYEMFPMELHAVDGADDPALGGELRFEPAHFEERRHIARSYTSRPEPTRQVARASLPRRRRHIAVGFSPPVRSVL
jgi:phage FluMu protein gp41